MIESLKHTAHRVFELHEVNPIFCVPQRASLVVGVAERGPVRVDFVEFDDPLSYRRADLLPVTFFDATDAALQRVYAT